MIKFKAVNSRNKVGQNSITRSRDLEIKKQDYCLRTKIELKLRRKNLSDSKHLI